jgi:WS/DGAT/MGAT family acyltransferase
MDDGRETFMRDTDAFTWRMEGDPGLRSTIVSVAWLKSSPDWDVIVRRMEQGTRAVPTFRMVVVEPPARLASPRWVVSPEFDLSWHLRRMDAPAPHTPATVVEFARTAAMTEFDPAYPLWEFTLVENLVGGRAALVMKVHHALTDGVGGMELAPLLFDLEPDADPPVDDLPEPPGERISGPGLVAQSLIRQAGRAAGAVGQALTGAVPWVVRAARNPLRAAGDVGAMAASIGRTVAPVRRTMSPLMTGRSLQRHLDLLSVPLPALKAAASAGGGTVNDAFLTGITGGLARYHQGHGAPVDELRVTMPISLRTDDDPAGGNRITLQRFVVPVGAGDTAARMRAVRACSRSATAEPALPHSNAIAGALNVVPTGVLGEMLKHVDFLGSNVPAPAVPLYLGGAEVTGLFAWGPTIGASLNVTLLSYRGTCCIGVTFDTAAVPDPDVLMTCLQAGFDELLALGARRPPRARRPLVSDQFPGVPARRVSSRPGVPSRR